MRRTNELLLKLSTDKSFQNILPLLTLTDVLPSAVPPQFLFKLSGKYLFFSSWKCNTSICCAVCLLTTHTADTHSRSLNTHFRHVAENKKCCVFLACVLSVIWWVCFKPHEATLASSVSWLSFCLPVLTAGNFPIAAGPERLTGCLTERLPGWLKRDFQTLCCC